MILQGDALHVPLADEAVDAIVTDPPYGLKFMGKDWDHGIPGVPFWTEAMRVLKPGGHLLAFGGTRTHHRLMCAIEDAGFEIRDCLSWLYGSGFPKSHNGPWGGTALKPAWEPIVMARKPFKGTVAANVLAHGTGGLNIDASRIGVGGGTRKGNPPKQPSRGVYGDGINGACDILPTGSGRWPANLVLSHHEDCNGECVDGCPVKMLDAQSGELVSGANPTRRGGLGCHGAAGQLEAYAPRGKDSGGASRFFYTAKASRSEREAGLRGFNVGEFQSGCAGDMPVDDKGKDRDRFKVRARNHHPTVKPLDLMRWLVRLVTPPGGLVLDPFMGSGTTGCACVLEGFQFVGLDTEPEYVAIAQARIEHWTPDQLTLGVA